MKLPEFKRHKVDVLFDRLLEPQPFIQVVTGPRQVGKTTALLQIIEKWPGPTLYASADAPAPPGPEWIEQNWRTAEIKSEEQKPTLLVLDEIQKVHGWDESVKYFRDQSKYQDNPIRVILCGSSSLQIQTGLTESLAGRFEILSMPHWSYPEMRDCFGWDINTYIYHGGYPGAAALIHDPKRWADYIQQSLVETAIGKDILLLHRVEKPALLRQLYALGCDYAGQVVSYQKLLGQLHDAGNTTTLAHYQRLLEGAFLIRGLPKWHGTKLRTRASSPKWQPHNTALVTSQTGLPLDQWRQDPQRWGRLVETAVGAHLINQAEAAGCFVHYWRERNKEVDFVLSGQNRLAALEVKSGAFASPHSGLSLFQKRWPTARTWLIGPGGLDLADFFQTSPADLL